MTDDLDPLGEIAEWRREREVRERNERTLRPGIYRTADGAIYRVRLNRHKSRVYSERWAPVGDRWKFDYDPDAIAGIQPEDRIPLEDARQISREVGQCLACARLLTDPESQAAGIGPSCARSWTYAKATGLVQRNLQRHTSKPKRSVHARVAGERLVINSDFDEVLIGIIKTFNGAEWDARAYTWSLPREHATALAVAFELAGIPHDDIAAIAMGWVV